MGSLDEALAALDSAMDFLNGPGREQADPASLGAVLKALAAAGAKHAAARMHFLARFDALDGHDADGFARWHCHIEDEEALVVLRRPGPREVSDADKHIYRLICEEAAGRDTAPWSFHIATPDGASELMHNGEVWPDVPYPRPYML